MPKSSDAFRDDNELENASSSDAGLTLASDWNIGQPLGFDESPRDQSEEMSFDFGSLENPSSSYSLDDFDSNPNPTPETPNEPGLGSQSTSGEEFSGTQASKDIGEGRRRKKLKVLLLSALACIGALSAIAVPVYKTMKTTPPPTLLGQKTIRHAIAVPEFQEEFEFLVLATSEKDKNLISMRLDFVFSASNAFEDFAEKNYFYRETVYQYLLRARPSKNSQKLWQGILEKQLMDHMKQNFPRSGLKNIRVAHWERL